MIGVLVDADDGEDLHGLDDVRRSWRPRDS
jgi:hypothetical protein